MSWIDALFDIDSFYLSGIPAITILEKEVARHFHGIVSYSKSMCADFISLFAVCLVPSEMDVITSSHEGVWKIFHLNVACIRKKHDVL